MTLKITAPPEVKDSFDSAWNAADDSQDGIVKALSTCTTRGTDTKSGLKIDKSIAATADDGYYDSNSQFFNDEVQFGITEPIYFLGDDFAGVSALALVYHYTWVRFTDIQIPNSATVNYACLTFTCDGYSAGTTADIKGNDVDDAVAPTDSLDAEGKERTTNQVEWETTAWDGDIEYESPNIACVVQEIIDRSGWSSGNDIMFFLEGTAKDVNYAYDYDEDDEKVAVLEIWWSLMSAIGL